MECEQFERSWIRAARKALGQTGPRRGSVRVPSARTIRDPAVAGVLLPLSSYVEAYQDYHG